MRRGRTFDAAKEALPRCQKCLTVLLRTVIVNPASDAVAALLTALVAIFHDGSPRGDRFDELTIAAEAAGQSDAARAAARRAARSAGADLELAPRLPDGCQHPPEREMVAGRRWPRYRRLAELSLFRESFPRL
jgi:hypothetical protein